MPGNHLYEKSDTVYWIDVCMSHKRKCRLKNYKEIRSIAKSDPDSETFSRKVFTRIITLRDQNSLTICLYDVVANYYWYGRDNAGNRVYRKLTKPQLPNHKLFDPENDS